MEREAQLQDKLKSLIESLIQKGYRFAGLDITKVERDWPLERREVDLVLFTRGEVPFMFIETKRKGKRGEGGLFDPIDASVVGQVMTYAAIYKRSHPDQDVPFVATANPQKIAIFRTPTDFSRLDWKATMERDYAGAIRNMYRTILEEHLVGEPLKLSLTEEFISFLLESLAKQYLEKRILQAKPTEALLERFRSFVDTVAEKCAPLLELNLKEDKVFRKEVERLGYKLEDSSTVRNLVRMMAYVLLNKILFRKLLERSYKLPYRLSYVDSSSRVKFMEDLKRAFDTAVEYTKDFEPIFRTGIYDRIPFPDDPELREYFNDFLYDLESVDLEALGDKIGYMYETLIPPEERHQLGQFYTPPWVCEFITRWCIRTPEDVVLDPGVGSGGFLLQAYRRLFELKTGEKDLRLVQATVHEKILEQLYALDLNPFPAHLSAMGLSMRNIKTPSTKLNILVSDFFFLQPGQKILTPYKVKSVVRGEEEREITIPRFDSVIGNPPYTRWTEIPDDTKKFIKRRLGKLMKKYGLTPQVSRGVEPGIYTYWIMHATDFLKEGGRLGMIVSNTWLQTDYGIGFGNFLLDNFRVKAIIDFAAKLFKGALITTCIVLAEKESDETKRLENEVAFIHIPGEVESVDVEGLLDAVATGSSKKYGVAIVKQRELPRNRKWIDMFSSKKMDISNHPFVTKLGNLFELSDGNATYLFLASTGRIRGVKNVGSDEFYYLSHSKVKEHRLEKWAYPNVTLNKALIYPALTSARQTNFFVFTEEDWERSWKSDDKCYMFVCHEPREKLPKEVEDYIRWGETKCRTKIRGTRRGGRLACKTEAARAREKDPKNFYGWYDLGGVVPAIAFVPRRAWRKSRFTLCKFPIAADDSLEALIPKDTSFTEVQIKALLAYLNSSFTQYYIETRGIKSPGGAIGFEGAMARETPVLDVRKLNNEQLNLLAKLFDELEQKARKIGGASTREQVKELKPKIYEIDRAVAKILGIKDEDIKNMEIQVDLMIERRVSGAKTH